MPSRPLEPASPNGELRTYRPFRVELPDGRAYWSVVDDEYAKVVVADRFLFDLRFGRDRAESSTRVYAGELSRFLSWTAETGRSLEVGARELSRFVLVLRSTPIERPGAGHGRPPGSARINHVLAVVREFFEHAVAAGAVVVEFLMEHRGRRISDHAMRAEQRRTAAETGLDGATPHQLRHRYASTFALLSDCTRSLSAGAA